MSRVELYVAGFPCQPFSSSGSREGTEDKLGRGSIFKYIFRYISKRRPRVYVLENVRGLSTHPCYGEMLTALRSLSLYNVYTRILNPEVRRGNVSYVGYRSFCWVNQTLFVQIGIYPSRPLSSRRSNSNLHGEIPALKSGVPSVNCRDRE